MPSGDRALALLQRGWLLSLWPAAQRFALAQRWPARAQARRLARILRANAKSAYGRAHRFEGIDSVAAFQARVPKTDHEALSPWLARVIAGEASVLTEEPVRLMERSGGSTGTATKLIPYTQSLLTEFGGATGPWLFDLHRRWPALVGSQSYWSLSPVAQGPRRTAGGVPIGMEDDTEYFGPVRRFVIARSMAVSGEVARAPDFAAWRRATLVGLVGSAHLGLISVWSPTFLTLLMEGLEADLDAVLARLPHARATEVRRAFAAGKGAASEGTAGEGVGRRLWPRLQVISCWTDGPSAMFIADLRRWFPGVPIQPKGLLATEGVVSIPMGDAPGGALALTSHFLEFVDLDRPEARPRLAHELRVGARYSPLLTTGGGLYRYHLKDVLECTAPLRVRFVEKLDRVADLAGEKIHVAQVDAALREATARLDVALAFALLAPVCADDRALYYCLYLESAAGDAALDAIAAHVERRLLEGHAYRYCRDLGQLAPLRLQRVSAGHARYVRALVDAGLRAGDIKPSVLDARALFGAALGVGSPLTTRESSTDAKGTLT